MSKLKGAAGRLQKFPGQLEDDRLDDPRSVQVIEQSGANIVDGTDVDPVGQAIDASPRRAFPPC